MKARDFVDVYLISKKFGVAPEDLKEDVVAKTVFALNLYAKYRNNFNEKKNLLKTKELFALSHEKGLLLMDIDESEFYAFLEKLAGLLSAIAEDVEEQTTKK